MKSRKNIIDELAESKIVDDIAKLATGALGTLSGTKRDIENSIHQRLERYLSSMNLVTREEFEVVKEMAEKARLENEVLKKRIETIEKKKNVSGKPKKQ